MKRAIVPVIILALAVTAFLNRDRWLPKPPGQDSYLGYVEGDTLLIGAPQAGRLTVVTAVESQPVDAGVTLFALDPAQLEAERARAEAAVVTAEANYRNKLSGKREEELAVIRAQIAQTQSALELARKDMKRTGQLAATGTAAQTRLDTAAEQVTAYEARLTELNASLAVAGLPARPAEIAAAASQADEARAAADLARRKLADLTVTAPKQAQVEDVFFGPGEWVTAGQPVVSLLSAEDVKLRFFVPEQKLAAASLGTRVTFTCDGCGEARTAVIVRTAAEPEYTPPVIYSQEARTKLVYLVEARPEQADAMLRPGLPVRVEPLP